MTFGTPSISRERLKIKTSNLAHRLATGGPNEKEAKLGQRVRQGVTDLLLEFWDSCMSSERLKLETSNLACRLATRGSEHKMQKLGQKAS